MMRLARRTWFIVGSVALAVAAIVIVATSWPAERDDVPTARVVRGKVKLDVYATGELRSVRSVSVTAPPVGGTLRLVRLADTGAPVKKGDVVLEFDPADQEYDLEQSRSELAQAEQEIVKMRADNEVQTAQDYVDLLTARFDVRRAELDTAAGEELVGGEVHQRDVVDAAGDELGAGRHVALEAAAQVVENHDAVSSAAQLLGDMRRDGGHHQQQCRDGFAPHGVRTSHHRGLEHRRVRHRLEAALPQRLAGILRCRSARCLWHAPEWEGAQRPSAKVGNEHRVCHLDRLVRREDERGPHRCAVVLRGEARRVEREDAARSRGHSKQQVVCEHGKARCELRIDARSIGGRAHTAVAPAPGAALMPAWMLCFGALCVPG